MCDVEEQVGVDFDGVQCLKNSNVDALPVKELAVANGVKIEDKQIQKYECGVEKENKKVRKKGRTKKKRKVSDPLVKDIAELMSNGLKIISPDKIYKGQSLQGDFLCNIDDCHTDSNKIVNNQIETIDDYKNAQKQTNIEQENMHENSRDEKKKVAKKKKHSRLSLNKHSEDICDEQEDTVDHFNKEDNEDSRDVFEQMKKNSDHNLINNDTECTQDVVDAKIQSKNKRKKHKKSKPPVFCTDSEDSEDFEDRKKSKKKKHSQTSMKSPKGKKFKDCSQQSKLNAFIQIKTPHDTVFENKEPKDACSRLKLSNNLFKSPRSSKKAQEKCEPAEKDKKSKETSCGEPEEKLTISIPEDCKTKELCVAQKSDTSSPSTQKKKKSANKVITTPKPKPTNEKSPISIPPVSPGENAKGGEIPTTPQRNAFQFMMNQRNKVIGSNSPGKVPTESPEDKLESIDKEKLAKRRKQFSEWNDSKGGTKRKEEEEERETYSEKVLVSRAKLMEEMLTGMTRDVEEDENKKRKKPDRKRNRVFQLETTSESSNDSLVSNPSKRSRLIIPDEESNKSNNSGKVQKDLLNFFGVLQKDTCNEDVIRVYEDETVKPVALKVKLFKSRGKRKKSSLSLKGSLNDSLTDDDNIEATMKKATDDEASRVSIFSDVSESTNSSVDVKRNKKSKSKLKETANISFASIKNKLSIKLNNFGKEVIGEDVHIEDIEDVQVVDDNAGTRRSVRKKTAVTYAEDDLESSQPKVGPNKEDKEKKVAPVFLKSAPKPKEDPAVVQARLEFLRSGVPIALKKIAEKQQSIEDIDFDIFPLISHVQQKGSNPSPLWNLPPVQLNLTQTENINFKHGSLSLGKVTTANIRVSSELKLRPVTKLLKYKTILEDIKTQNPDYPVYKTFRLLSEKAGRCFENPTPSASPVKTPTAVKRKRGRPRKKPVIDDDVVILEEVATKDVNLADHAMWTEKYKPRSSQEIIGNYKNVSDLKNWLSGWIEFSKEVRMARRKRRSDSSDFESTDGETRDSFKSPCNTMILCGPLGSGKSVAVYAVCQELGVNVLEINASSKRTGKKLLQDMQEATQSHQVSKKNANSLAVFLQKEKVPKELQEAKSRVENKMCILLIEDADIVFEQDEGFISALNQLILTSKRPVVLLTSNVDCNYMQKFTSTYPVLNFTPLSAKTLATWLQIVCLLEGVHVDKSTVGELLEWNQGDVRRTLLQLQFWVHTGGNPEDVRSETSSLYKKYCDVNTIKDFIYEDDTSSFLSHFEELETIEGCVLQNDCIRPFVICTRQKLSIPYPVNLGVIWWNLSDLLIKFVNDESNVLKKKKEELAELQSAWDVLDALSFTDVLYRAEGFDAELEPAGKRWEDGLKEGLSLKEDGLEFKTDRNLTREISHNLVEGYCRLHNPDFDYCLNMAVPVATERRWRTKRQKCESEYFNVIPPSYSVHRSTFAVDYFPMLRTISRTESERARSNSKRGNRFYNYLRTLNIHPSKSMIKTACDMMSTRV